MRVSAALFVFIKSNNVPVHTSEFGGEISHVIYRCLLVSLKADIRVLRHSNHPTFIYNTNPNNSLSQNTKSINYSSVHLSIFCSRGKQIRSLSTDRRPGTKFLCRLSPRGSEPSLLPKVEKKTWSPPSGQELCVRIILDHGFPPCLPAAIGEYWQWLFTSTPWRNEWGKCIRWPVILSVY